MSLSFNHLQDHEAYGKYVMHKRAIVIFPYFAFQTFFSKSHTKLRCILLAEMHADLKAKRP
jgi:hypothetical protein